MSTAPTASTTRPRPLPFLPAGTDLLRLALGVDAVVTGANGVAYLALAGPLGDLFHLPAGGLRAAGAFLIVFALGVGALARQAAPPRAAVRVVVLLNALWVVESLVLLAAGWGSPGTVGEVWIALQAVVVGAFAGLQALGLRRRP
ncbi:MAG TPA: hypothetical protein VD931_12335 [Baekduia sp.]|nr:hypothetical protein [Baekduia sp.]